MKKKKKRNKLKALGVYIFAGLFTEGVKQHFDVVAHLEEGQFGVKTAAANNPGMPIYDNLKGWPIAELSGEIDFVYGNPPCAPWSAASHGRQIRWQDDPRVACWHHAFSLLDTLSPKVWAFESVQQAFTKGREMMDDFSEKARQLGYATTFLMVDAQNHGIPQRRRRFFLVLHKVELPWKPTHGEQLTVQDALDSVEELGFCRPLKPWVKDILDRTKGKVKKRGLRSMFDYLNKRKLAKVNHHNANLKEGETKMVVKGRPAFLTHVLDPDTVSGVVLGNNMIHPNRKRFISENEVKALNGVREDFQMAGGESRIFSELTKAVMPPVAEYLAKIVKNGIKADKPVDPNMAELVRIHCDEVEKESIRS